MAIATTRDLDALATLYAYAELDAAGQLDHLSTQAAEDAAAWLARRRDDAGANYLRRVAIAHLRLGRPERLADRLRQLLREDEPGENTCDYEYDELPSDRPDPDAPGARVVAFKLRVRRILNHRLRALLDPQAWDDCSAYMLKAHAMDPADAAKPPPDQHVPEIGAPPAKGTDWSGPLYEHFKAPLVLGGAEFQQVFDIATTVGTASYGFTYQLVRCRWSVIGWLAGPGGTTRNQGGLIATEGNDGWTTIKVSKSLQIGPRGPYSGDQLTMSAAWLLKAGWHGELQQAVTACP
jgi:hypothetical protein